MPIVSPFISFCLRTLRTSVQVTKAKKRNQVIDPITSRVPTGYDEERQSSK